MFMLVSQAMEEYAVVGKILTVGRGGMQVLCPAVEATEEFTTKRFAATSGGVMTTASCQVCASSREGLSEWQVG
jgi:hypothetical protein